VPRVTRLSQRGADRLLDLVGEVNGLATLPAFRAELLPALQRAVPSLHVSYNEVGPGGVWAFAEPELPSDSGERWARWAHQHPVLTYMQRTRDGRPRRISDHLDRDAFARTELFQSFYAPLGVASQVAFGLPAVAPLVIGIALSRGGDDFSDDEVALLARARPHLIQAYRTAQATEARERVIAALSRGLTSDGRSAVAVTRAGEVVFADAAAREALGLAGDDGAVLPRELHAAVARDRSAPRRLAPNLRLIPGAGPGELDVLLVHHAPGGLTVERLRDLGLTAREAEALRHLALGSAGPDIARAMGIAPRTAAKHLQAVYAKLGVTSRSEAARAAWAAVDGEP
jgi:DNA-binding CsgD family transcriptional regulator